MTAIVSTKMEGFSELRQVLKSTDKKLLTQTQKAMRQAASPMVAQARAMTPSDAPLSGWAHNGRTGWRQNEVLAGIGVKTGGRRLTATEWPLLSLQQKNAAGMIYDWAGRAGMANSVARSRPYARRPSGHRNTSQGRTLVDKIPRFGAIKGSQYSRVIFPAFAATRQEVVRAVADGVELAAQQINVEVGMI